MNRIVVIEDDPRILRGLTDNLRCESYDVSAASDGERGYRLVREKRPDLVILDLMLPGLNGYEICRRIRRDGLVTPILMLTAQDQESNRVQGFEAGADDYVTKPFSIKELLGRVRAILRRSGQEDLDEARRIQERLLPVEIPQVSGFQIDGCWPARVVGGDYFDVLKFDDNCVGLCIADVCGKGLPAALTMANLQATVRAYASKWTSPRELCETVNRVMCDNIATGRFISLFYAVLDAGKRRLVYSNAGHNPPILSAHDGSVLCFEHGGAVLGVFHDGQYDQGEIGLTPGDRFVLYTDGITEARNADDEQFGERRLMYLMERARNLNAPALTQWVIQTATRFSNGNFDDDLTVVSVSVD
jgi:sigma-B regulation protein RsbU (phosphoserine phosphatase)